MGRLRPRSIYLDFEKYPGLGDPTPQFLLKNVYFPVHAQKGDNIDFIPETRAWGGGRGLPS